MKKTLAVILSVLTMTLATNITELTANAVEPDINNISSEQALQSSSLIDSGTCGANTTWTLDANYCLTISGTGSISGWASSSSTPWYKYQSYIKTAIIEPGVTTVHFSSFFQCYRLESVKIPDSVTKIGWCAFSKCTSLKSIEISKNVVDIHDDAFSGCTMLEKIKVDVDNTNYCDVNGVLFNKDKTKIMQYPAGIKAKSYIIPSGVEIIDNSAFNGSENLLSITIPNGVTAINGSAFEYCTKLTAVSLPHSVEYLGGSAFSDCSNLEMVKLSKNLPSIYASIFNYCPKLKDVCIYNKECEIVYDSSIPAQAAIRDRD